MAEQISEFERIEASVSQHAAWGNRVVEARERIRNAVRRTPVEEISELVPESRARLFAKLENLQETGSFKLRGAMNRILGLTHLEKSHGIVAASNGNHGLGVAAAAKRARVSAEVYVATQVSPGKVRRIEAHGARVRQEGADPLETEKIARARAEESGQVFISPYNDWEVLSGQGTIAVELTEQIPHLDAVFVAVGGGGLIGGIGAYLKHASPGTEVVGCWPENSPVLYEALKVGRIVPVAEKSTLSESTAGGLEEDSITLEICRSVVDRAVLVSEEEILHAMRLVSRRKHWRVEGAAGVALAAFIRAADRYQAKNVAVILCGGNLSERVRNLL